MHRPPNVFGFTLIELLVTLTLLGLVASFAIPNVQSWLASRGAASDRASVAARLAIMPLEVARSGADLTIVDDSLFTLDNSALLIEEPVRILSNGYCLGGKISLQQQSRTYKYRVTEPFCHVLPETE